MKKKTSLLLVFLMALSWTSGFHASASAEPVIRDAQVDGDFIYYSVESDTAISDATVIVVSYLEDGRVVGITTSTAAIPADDPSHRFSVARPAEGRSFKLFLLSASGLPLANAAAFKAPAEWQEIVLTDGQPTGEEEEIVYFLNTDRFTGTETPSVQSYTRWDLNNGYVRFTLNYTAPEGYEISIFDPPQGHEFMMIGKDATSEGAGVLCFDLSPNQLASIDGLTVMFHKSDDNRFFVYYNLTGQSGGSSGGGGGGTASHPIIHTSGNPGGVTEIINYSINDQLTEGQIDIHSYDLQELDNGYFRLILDYSAPVGYCIFIYDPSHAMPLVMKDDRGTSGSREQLIFDLKREELFAAKELIVNFRSPNDEDFYVFFTPSTERIVLTTGKTVGAAEAIETQDIVFANTFPSDSVELHSFTRQELDNGYIRFSLEYTVADWYKITIYDPPTCEHICMFCGIDEPKTRCTLRFDVSAQALSLSEELIISFRSSSDERFSISYPTDHT